MSTIAAFAANNLDKTIFLALAFGAGGSIIAVLAIVRASARAENHRLLRHSVDLENRITTPNRPTRPLVRLARLLAEEGDLPGEEWNVGLRDGVAYEERVRAEHADGAYPYIARCMGDPYDTFAPRMVPDGRNGSWTGILPERYELTREEST